MKSVEKETGAKEIALVIEKALECCGMRLAHNCFTWGRLIRIQYLNND